jgi:hypothetical protein
MFCFAFFSSSASDRCEKILERGAHHRQRLGCLILARLQSDHEWTAFLHRREITVSRVSEAAFLADFLGDARHEASATEDVVADEQRESNQVVAFDAGRADQKMALRGRVRDGADFAARERRHRRQRCGVAGLRQACSQFFGDRFRFGAAQIAYQSDDCPLRGVMATVERSEVVARHPRERFNLA